MNKFLDMQIRFRLLALALTLLVILPGCTSPKAMEDSDETVNELDLPERLNLVADTAGRDIDRGSQMNIIADANGSNTLLMWVSTGCSGCHDWTEMIAESMRNGSISNDTRIITVLRYPSFESSEEVIEVYATENSTTNSLWPVLMPFDGQSAIDLDKGEETEYDFQTAFGNPATPSFTLIDGDGNTLWKNKQYWANYTLLTDALELLDS